MFASHRIPRSDHEQEGTPSARPRYSSSCIYLRLEPYALKQYEASFIKDHARDHLKPGDLIVMRLNQLINVKLTSVHVIQTDSKTKQWNKYRI